MLYEVRAEVGTAQLEEASDPAQAKAMAEMREAALRRMFAAVLKVLDASGLRLQVMDRDNVAGMEWVSFSVVATRRAHARMLSDLRANDAANQVVAFRDTEDE